MLSILSGLVTIKRERHASTKRTAARHNERTEPHLPDGKRLHKAKEQAALVPFKGSAPGACHQCGEFGHWRRECPKWVATGATYPFLYVLSKDAEDTCSGVMVYFRVCILLDCLIASVFGGRNYVPLLGC